MSVVVNESVKYDPLSPLEAGRIIGGETVRTLRDLVRRRLRRGGERVKAEYDQGSWKSLLEGKPWLRHDSLREYLVPGDDSVRVVKIGHRLVRTTTRQYYRFRLQTLQDVIARYAGDARDIVELGCGTGNNLFSLSLTGRWERLWGFDISENGVRAAQEAASHFGLSNAEFGILNLTDAGAENFERLRGKTAFTYYCLEQLKYSTHAVIENLVNAGVRRVIHIEPATEMLRLWSPSDLLTYLYVTKMDYQDNLLRTLEEFQRKKLVRITDKERLGYAPTCRNDPMLICWERV